jgi:hypothetical protein
MTQIDLQHNQEMNLAENERSITAANQNSSIARIVNIVYFLFGVLELLLAVRVVLHLDRRECGQRLCQFHLWAVRAIRILVRQSPEKSGTERDGSAGSYYDYCHARVCDRSLDYRSADLVDAQSSALGRRARFLPFNTSIS